MDQRDRDGDFNKRADDAGQGLTGGDAGGTTVTATAGSELSPAAGLHEPARAKLTEVGAKLADHQIGHLSSPD
ncbi:hypothetical protein GCM10010424_72610 [Streptomyces lienomycini]